jgi:hypothetical protein
LRNNDNTTCTNHALIRCKLYKTKTKQTKIFPIKEGALNKLMESVYKHIPFLQAEPR